MMLLQFQMFAPEDVFKKTPLPRGHYWPSPMVNQRENVKFQPDDIENLNKDVNVNSKDMKIGTPASKKVSITEPNINDGKENFRPISRTVDKDTASTSVDDLIRDIDENLDIDIIKPTPSSKTKVDNILSVSDHSDTSLKVLSPGSLNYYLNRFKHSHPTHPSKRPLQTSPLFEAEEVKIAKNLPSSNDSSYNTLTLDTSSYLERIVSSDDSTEWNFTNISNEDGTSNISRERPVSSDCSDSITPTAVPNLHQTKHVSFIEQLTGKTFSELSEVVPKEVINPTDESEDILYQWRLKKHINEAKKSLPIDDSCLKACENTLHHSQSIPANRRMVFQHRSSSPQNVSKEIQTDVEKRESSCQADITSDHSCRNELVDGPNMKVKFLNPALSHILDSCSDISISSVSTDDLTNISDLDEEQDLLDHDVVHNDDMGACNSTSQETNVPLDSTKSCQEFPISGRGVTHVETPVEKPIKQSNSELENPLELLQNNTSVSEDCGHHKTEVTVSTNQVDVEELLSYLDNIRSNFDDELLNIFIDRYQNVLTQMSEIEDEINRQCNED